jgi:hypothetical protein
VIHGAIRRSARLSRLSVWSLLEESGLLQVLPASSRSSTAGPLRVADGDARQILSAFTSMSTTASGSSRSSSF